jgi:RNA polymerase sigma-70 factor, ECF subfamily
LVREDGDFADFYAANYGRTVALVTAMLADRHEAEDIAQEAFARALPRWTRLRRYDSPEAWIRQVALRLAIDSRRRVKRAAKAAAALTWPDTTADPLTDLAIGRAMLPLPAPQRVVVFLHYHVDLTVTQIPRELWLPESTVKARLASGRRRLERELSAFSRREVASEQMRNCETGWRPGCGQSRAHRPQRSRASAAARAGARGGWPPPSAQLPWPA